MPRFGYQCYEIGRTRRKLVERLRQLRPDWATLEPHKLTRNNPRYASAEFDACSWAADFRNTKGQIVHIYSWDSMGELLKAKTISISQHPSDTLTNDWELIAE